jgi:flagellar biogenesis protein FliO
MPTTRAISMSPWKLTLMLGLILGVWFFQPFFTTKVLALDSNSPLFEKNQGNAVDVDKDKSAPPLALPEETPNPSPGLFSTLVRVIFALTIIVGLIVITVWGVKLVWEKQGWNHLSEPGKPIKILSTTYLGPQKSIQLVEIGKRLLVVGVGKEEVNCLDVISQPEEVEALKQATQQGFPKIFSRIVQKHETVQQEADTHKIIAESNELVGGYVAKLKKISKKKSSDNPGDGNT